MPAPLTCLFISHYISLSFPPHSYYLISFTIAIAFDVISTFVLSDIQFLVKLSRSFFPDEDVQCILYFMCLFKSSEFGSIHKIGISAVLNLRNFKKIAICKRNDLWTYKVMNLQ